MDVTPYLRGRRTAEAQVAVTHLACVLGVKIWGRYSGVSMCKAGSDMVAKLIKILENFSKKVTDDHIGAYASSTAFFTFLSLIPMVMVLLSFLPFTPIQQETLLNAAATVMPDEMYDILDNIIQDLYSTSGVVFSITLAFTIWSAAKGTLSLMRGLNVIFEVEERRNYFVLRFRAALYTLAMLGIILILLVGVVFAHRIRDLLVGAFPAVKPMFDFLVSVRLIFVIGVLVLLFTTLYTYLPNAKNKFHWELPGAVFSALAWYFSSWIFSVYVNRVMGSNTYGSLTTVVVGMLWMYLIFYLILLGAALNRFLLETFQKLAARRRERRWMKKQDSGES